MSIINNSQDENKLIKEEIEHYNRKISVLDEFKNDLQKHLPVERVAKINKKLEQKKSYYSGQKFNLLANRYDADRSNNLAIIVMVFIAIGALGYFSTLYYGNYSNEFTGFSVSDVGNESQLNQNETNGSYLNESYQFNFDINSNNESQVQGSSYQTSGYESSSYRVLGAGCENPPTTCGCTLNQSATLTQNFNCVNTHGLVLNGGNYTLDCNGYYLNSTNKSGGSYNGIYINGTNTNNITIKNCLILNWSTGIFIESTAGTNNKILDNTIRNNSNPGPSTYGIYIGSNNDYTLISGNKIYYPGGEGIYITSSANNNITHNLIVGTTAEGLYLSAANSNLVFNNTFAAASSYGLFINGANNNQVYYNNFTNASAVSISGGSTGNTFNTSKTTYGGNFWEMYDTPVESCYDTNRDAFCDDVYQISGGVNDSLAHLKSDIPAGLDVDANDLMNQTIAVNENYTYTMVDIANNQNISDNFTITLRNLNSIDTAVVNQSAFVNVDAYSKKTITLTVGHKSPGTFKVELNATSNSTKTYYDLENTTLTIDYYLTSYTAFNQNMSGSWSSPTLTTGDVNNDGKQDLIVIGNNGGNRKTLVYLNNGTTFTDNAALKGDVIGFTSGSIGLADLDRNGWLDLIVIAINDSDNDVKVYSNNGTRFNLNSSWATNLERGAGNPNSISLFDYNNDGTTDLLKIGNNGSGTPTTRLFKNNGSMFVDDTSILLNKVDLGTGAAAYGDFDKDGYMDIIISGVNSSSTPFTRVFINNRTHFINNIYWGAELPDVSDSEISIGDINNDSWLDLVVTGRHNSSLNYAQVFLNNGSRFVRNSIFDTFLNASAYNSNVIGDYDGDGDIDLIITGDASGNIIKAFKNNGTHFVPDSAFVSQISGFNGGTSTFVDVDGDKDLDYIAFHSSSGAIYKNPYNNTLTYPNVPTFFRGTFSSDGRINLTWTGATDTETPAAGLYYQIRVGNCSGCSNIISNQTTRSAKPELGMFGNMLNRNFVYLNITNQTYYWAVKTIDASHLESNYSSEQTYPSFVPEPNVTLTVFGNGAGIYLGQNYTYIVQVTNPSNIIDNYTIAIDNFNNINYSIANISITPNITIGGAINISIIIGHYKTNNGTFVIRLNATSTNDTSRSASVNITTAINTLTCNATLNTTTFMLANLSHYGSNSNCLSISGNNITLDCQGFYLFGDKSSGQNGIQTFSNNFTTIANCRIYNFTTGISNQEALGSINNGYHLIKNNIIAQYGSSNNNGYGIIVTRTKNNTIFNNTFRDSTATSAMTGVGLWFTSTDYNNISFNIFNNASASTGSSSSIMLASSSNNTFHDNMITNSNMNMIIIAGETNYSIFFNNNFSTSSVSSSGSINYWNNSNRGNYWGSYENPLEGCLDTNVNGICDTAYTITGNETDYLPLMTVPSAGLDIQTMGNTTTPLDENETFTIRIANNQNISDNLTLTLRNLNNVDIAVLNQSIFTNISAYSTVTVELKIGDNTIGIFAVEVNATSNSTKSYYDLENLTTTIDYYFVQYTAFNQNLTTSLSAPVMAVGDVNNDGKKDMVVIGNSGSRQTFIYLNNGTSFNDNPAYKGDITGFDTGSIGLADIDRNGWLDAIIYGDNTNPSRDVKVYLNNGTRFNINSMWNISLHTLDSSSISIFDYNNDGTSDLLVTGMGPSGPNPFTYLYKNNGTTFLNDTTYPLKLQNLQYGSVAYGDFDNNNYLDFVLSGRDSISVSQSYVYMNNGTNFVNDTDWSAELPKLYNSDLAVGDIDNDGKLDLIISGVNDTNRYTQVFLNNGTRFRRNTAFELNLNQTDYSSTVLGDYDGDGDLDLVIAGMYSSPSYTTINAYKNNGTHFIDDDIFTNIIAGYNSGTSAFLDVDNDKDLDYITFSSNGGGVYKNPYNNTLTYPNKVKIFRSSLTSDGLINLTWNKATDTETPSNGLYYQIRVGNCSGCSNIISNQTTRSGKPTQGAFGNVFNRNFVYLNITNQTYYWAVKTIDASHLESNYSVEYVYPPDTIAPNITNLTYPANNSVLTTSTIQFNFTATDNIAILNCTLYGNFSGSFGAVTGTESITNNTLHNFTYSVNDGKYIWTIRCFDVAENSVYFASNYTLSVDTTTPVINSITITPEQGSAGTVFNITANITDTTTGVSKAVLYLQNPDETNLANYTLTASENLFNVSWNSSNFENGTYALDIIVNDTSGNSKEYDNIASIVISSSNSTIYRNTSINFIENSTLLINTTTTTNSTVEITTLVNVSSASVNIIKYNTNPENVSVTSKVAINTFLHILVNNETNSRLREARIRVYYLDAEITASNINESTLKMYRFNTTNYTWLQVNNSGVDTTNNFVYANITSFSSYAAFGSENVAESSPSPSPSSSGGGGGGGTAAAAQYNVNMLAAEQKIELKKGEKIIFSINGIIYELEAIRITATQTEFTLSSGQKSQELKISDKESVSIDLNKDSITDIILRVSILAANKFELGYKRIFPETCFDGIKNQNEEQADCGGKCVSCAKPKEAEKKKSEIVEEKQVAEKIDAKVEQPRNVENVNEAAVKNKLEPSAKQSFKESLITIQQILLSWSKIILLVIIVLSGSYAVYRRYDTEQVLETPQVDQVEAQQEIINEQSPLILPTQTTQKVENVMQQIQAIQELPPMPQLNAEMIRPEKEKTTQELMSENLTYLERVRIQALETQAKNKIIYERLRELKEKDIEEKRRLSEQKKKEIEIKTQQKERKMQEELAKKKEKLRLANLKGIAADIDLMESLRKENIKKSQEQRLDWIKRVEMPESYKKSAIKSHKNIKKEVIIDQKIINEKTKQNHAQNKTAEQRRENNDISKKENRIELFKILQLEKKIFEVHGLYSLSKIRDAKALYNKIAAEYDALNNEEKKRVHKPIVELNRLLAKK